MNHFFGRKRIIFQDINDENNKRFKKSFKNNSSRMDNNFWFFYILFQY